MRLLACSLALFVGLLAGTASSQQDSVADALFRDARSAMRQGNYAEACPKLAESHRLDPSLGTLLNLALCEEKLGHLATAWTKYRELLDTAPAHDERRELARAHLASIEHLVPRLNVIVAEAPESARVSLDDVEIGKASFGVDVPIDPGEHRVALYTPARVLALRIVRVTAGEHLRVSLAPDVPETVAKSSSSAAPAAPAPPPIRLPAVQRTKYPRASEPYNRSELRAGYAAGALGVGSLGAAATLTILALHQKAIVDRECTQHECSASGTEAARDKARLLRLADVALAAGVAGVALGGYLVWHSGRFSTRVSVALTGASAVVAAELP